MSVVIRRSEAYTVQLSKPYHSRVFRAFTGRVVDNREILQNPSNSFRNAWVPSSNPGCGTINCKVPSRIIRVGEVPRRRPLEWAA